MNETVDDVKVDFMRFQRRGKRDIELEPLKSKIPSVNKQVEEDVQKDADHLVRKALGQVGQNPSNINNVGKEEKLEERKISREKKKKHKKDQSERKKKAVCKRVVSESSQDIKNFAFMQSYFSPPNFQYTKTKYSSNKTPNSETSRFHYEETVSRTFSPKNLQDPLRSFIKEDITSFFKSKEGAMKLNEGSTMPSRFSCMSESHGKIEDMERFKLLKR